MQKSVETSTGYFAEENYSDIEAVLREDLDALPEDFEELPDRFYTFDYSDNHGALYIQIKYVAHDYIAATNYSYAEIYAYVKVKGNDFELVSMKAYRTSDGSDDRIIVGTASYYNTVNSYFK